MISVNKPEIIWILLVFKDDLQELTKIFVKDLQINIRMYPSTPWFLPKVGRFSIYFTRVTPEFLTITNYLQTVLQKLQ